MILTEQKIEVLGYNDRTGSTALENLANDGKRSM